MANNAKVHDASPESKPHDWLTFGRQIPPSNAITRASKLISDKPRFIKDASVNAPKRKMPSSDHVMMKCVYPECFSTTATEGPGTSLWPLCSIFHETSNYLPNRKNNIMSL